MEGEALLEGRNVVLASERDRDNEQEQYADMWHSGLLNQDGLGRPEDPGLSRANEDGKFRNAWLISKRMTRSRFQLPQ
jgi:hypothetical protein